MLNISRTKTDTKKLKKNLFYRFMSSIILDNEKIYCYFPLIVQYTQRRLRLVRSPMLPDAAFLSCVVVVQMSDCLNPPRGLTFGILVWRVRPIWGLITSVFSTGISCRFSLSLSFNLTSNGITDRTNWRPRTSLLGKVISFPIVFVRGMSTGLSPLYGG